MVVVVVGAGAAATQTPALHRPLTPDFEQIAPSAKRTGSFQILESKHAELVADPHAAMHVPLIDTLQKRFTVTTPSFVESFI